MATKVLNLYAGIGGNRKLWEDVEVTAVEWDEEKAEVYRDHFPEDTVVEADAHVYLLDHYDDYDFIWSSPPCQTHSKMHRLSAQSQEGWNKNRTAKYPDMSLYQEILLLENFFQGDWVVENVDPYYEPLIQPQEVGRHSFWANFHISEFETPPLGKTDAGETQRLEQEYGYDLSEHNFGVRKDQVISNCVHPELGQHVFESRNVQTTLV